MQSRGICHSFTGISDGLDMDGKGCLCFSVFKLLGTCSTYFFFSFFSLSQTWGLFSSHGGYLATTYQWVLFIEYSPLDLVISNTVIFTVNVHWRFRWKCIYKALILLKMPITQSQLINRLSVPFQSNRKYDSQYSSEISISNCMSICWLHFIRHHMSSVACSDC